MASLLLITVFQCNISYSDKIRNNLSLDSHEYEYVRRVKINYFINTIRRRKYYQRCNYHTNKQPVFFEKQTWFCKG